jgi:CO/xanthine dehydrogenase FAD-binding subunit
MWSEYQIPQSLDEALSVLARYEGRARVIAGGTDLALQAASSEVDLACAVDLTRIPELATIALDGADLVIGACATHAHVAANPLVRERAPLLAAACAAVGSPQIRNVGTIAGNIVNAQPAADAVLALLALDARVEIAGLAGRRQLPLAGTFLGPGKSAVDPSREIVVCVRFPSLGIGQRSAYARLARRRALALPMLAVAAVVSVTEGRFDWARIALGPVAPTPFRAARAEASLAAAPATAESIAHAAQLASEEAQPRSSILRGSKEYRKEMVQVLVRRVLTEAAGLDQR